ncbi:hypothetical protein BDA96_03G113800 [Sorghum bicolor]|uniref:Glycine-rich protein n=1 Tax=Sorghum bicolor TaxID=4558 RepID=A0A921UPI1_SORBI|nr:hypothetical protein BDA96_03G113800 [Sorghum bicolor]
MAGAKLLVFVLVVAAAMNVPSWAQGGFGDVGSNIGGGFVSRIGNAAGGANNEVRIATTGHGNGAGSAKGGIDQGSRSGGSDSTSGPSNKHGEPSYIA